MHHGGARGSEDPDGCEATQHVYIARVYSPTSVAASNWKFKVRMVTEGFAAVDRTLMLWELFNEVNYPTFVSLARLKYAGTGVVAAERNPV